jgi:Tfp pilus assembly protein PilX
VTANLRASSLLLDRTEWAGVRTAETTIVLIEIRDTSTAYYSCTAVCILVQYSVQLYSCTYSCTALVRYGVAAVPVQLYSYRYYY